MQSAKDTLKKFTSKSGQEDTTVHETVNPAVQNETVARHQHDKIIPAVDREVHQHHYHTTEQPVNHQETLQEQHHHKAIPVEKREFKHGNDDEDKRRVETAAAQYRNTTQRVEGEHTQSHEAGIEGQHTHHHVHETVQPVIQKQTIEPHVVHTTVPIHEVHHNESKHHAATALPAVSMDEFKRGGGSLTGREERQDFMQGEPKNFNDHRAAQDSKEGLRSGQEQGIRGNESGLRREEQGIRGNESGLRREEQGLRGNEQNIRDRDGYGQGTEGLGREQGLRGNESGLNRGNEGLGREGLRGNESDLNRGTESGLNRGTAGGLGGAGGVAGAGGAGGLGSGNTSGLSQTGTHGSSTSTGKPSLMDKLNPMKDSDGDGKKGFMK